MTQAMHPTPLQDAALAGIHGGLFNTVKVISCCCAKCKKQFWIITRTKPKEYICEDCLNPQPPSGVDSSW